MRHHIDNLLDTYHNNLLYIPSSLFYSLQCKHRYTHHYKHYRSFLRTILNMMIGMFQSNALCILDKRFGSCQSKLLNSLLDSFEYTTVYNLAYYNPLGLLQ